MRTILIVLMILLPLSGISGVHHKHFTKNVVPKNYNEILRLTAATLYLEAGGESNQGKLGVASVIWNRAHGATEIPNVILARKQFSCWNHRKFSSFKAPHNKEYAYCLLVARDMVNGTFVPPARYQGAIAYHEQSVRPFWRSSFEMLVHIGSHLFYGEKGWRA